MSRIYHITTREAALQAGESGKYSAESLEKQGFIHCSQVFQILNVANAFYSGQTDLVILVIDPGLLKAALKYEAPVHPGGVVNSPASEDAGLFPHVYGLINFDAVSRVVEFPCDPDGKFELPAALSQE